MTQGQTENPVANEFADENADASPRYSIKQSNNKASLEQIEINEAQAMYNRKKEMYRISSCLIKTLTFILILIIAIMLLFIGFNINKISEIKDLWHIYLISILSLTTLLSGAIYLNRLTWGNKNTDKAPDLASALIDLINKLTKDKK